MNSLDWNDLRYVLAVVRHGSAASAARHLGVSHATVLRRVQAVEQSVGTTLFDRLSTGHASTDAGHLMVALGESIEEAIMQTRRMIDGRATGLAGALRFTTTDSLANTLLPPILADFRERFPQIRVEMVVSNALLTLDRRDADITLRTSLLPPEDLVGMRLARMDFAAYAAAGYLDARPGRHWADLDWLLPEGSQALSPAGIWTRSAIKPERMVMTVDSFVSACHLAEAGIGVAVLPYFLGEGSPGLRRVRKVPREASSDLWVLTHPNLRQSARVQVFMEHISQALRAMRDRLEMKDALE